MTKNKQQRFEDDVMLECDLNVYDEEKGCIINFDIDKINGDFKLLFEISDDSDYEYIEHRKRLITFINYKFALLTNIQKQIAEYRFYYGYTIKKIANILCKDSSTIHYHIEKIKKLW